MTNDLLASASWGGRLVHALGVCCVWLIAALPAARTFGHGAPLQINGASGALVVSGGLALGHGFVAQAFDPSEDAGLDFPGVTVRTDLPGYDVTNVAGGVLQLEVLSRRDLSAPGAPQRWLWYWDPTLATVAAAGEDPDFTLRRKDLLGSVTFDQFDGTSASVLPITESLGLNSHQHYLRYELDNVPAAAFGVYGFFARVLAPGYAFSEPVLLAFGYGIDTLQYAAGANAINLAAAFAGDFDASGAVDGGDFMLWQRTLGATGAYPLADGTLDGVVDIADLVLWQSQYGEPLIGDSSIAAVPEPSSLVAAACVLAAWLRFVYDARRKPNR